MCESVLIVNLLSLFSWYSWLINSLVNGKLLYALSTQTQKKTLLSNTLISVSRESVTFSIDEELALFTSS